MSRGVRIVVHRSCSGSALLPRTYVYLDGDQRNNHAVSFGVDLAALYTDPLLTVGVEVGAAPRSLVGRALTVLRWGVDT